MISQDLYEDLQTPVAIALESSSGEPIATATIPGLSRQWKKYEVDLTAKRTDEKALKHP